MSHKAHWIGLAVVIMFPAVVTSFTTPICRPGRRRQLPPSSLVPLFSTRKETTTHQPRAKHKVLFQTVVRPFNGLPDVLFLGYLVEYLQDRFCLPERLPMVYTATVSESDEHNRESVVVQWNSPLSPDAAATRLNVKVVGIVTEEGEQQVVPSMAMVVVDKQNASEKSSFAPMLANLFEDSEKKIIKALDRGLQEFMAGEIQDLGGTPNASTVENKQQKQTLQQGQESILAELMEDDDEQGALQQQQTKDKKQKRNSVIEAHIVQKNGADVANDKSKAKQTAAAKQQEQRNAALDSMKQVGPAAAAPPPATAIEKPAVLDFAVRAAKRAQAKRKAQGVQDFAVLAAKSVASRQQHSSSSVKPRKQLPDDQLKVVEDKNSINDDDDDDNDNDTEPAAAAAAADPAKSIHVESIRPPVLDPPEVSGVKRAFMTTISTPNDFLKQQEVARKSKSAEKATTNAPEPTRKNINVNVRTNEKEPVIGSADSVVANEGDSDGIVKAAQDALTEIADNSKDLTPEELLSEVMKFDNQQEREKTVGDGFVSGAFEKAKDLLREQRSKRDERATAAASSIEVKKKKAVKELTPEEELRRMFAAGERIADGRITTMTSPDSSDAGSLSGKQTTESDIDSLIDSDRTVSRHARVLDDELTELEVRINKSPGEAFDAPSDNALFDIFSGPEVYNPNVDPETAVNWPGALPGTKRVRLPAELDEAIKQAKFASEVLMTMHQVDEAGGGAESQQTYKVGKRELSGQQVNNLRAVVQEAVEIGLIDDPLEVQAEASRLQMLLDELFDQPEERMREITSNYKDLMLSDNFVQLVKQRLNEMADRDLDALRNDDDSLESTHARERELLGQLVVYAQLLLKETRALGAELESQQIEIVRSICKVAMDPSHQTEEETAMALADAVRDMRPLLDDGFVAYLKYAVAEEEGRLARAGRLDDPEHNQWLFVLKIVQQGVYSEISRGINRYVEHIWYILRMETPVERRMLLEKLVDVMPTLDVRPFVQVVENIVGALGDSARGEFDGVTPLGEMTNKLLQLHRDVKQVLPPERIAEKSRDADEWAAKQKERMLEMRNLSKQRLKAAQDTEHLDAEIEAIGRRSGEVERFD